MFAPVIAFFASSAVTAGADFWNIAARTKLERLERKREAAEMRAAANAAVADRAATRRETYTDEAEEDGYVAQPVWPCPKVSVPIVQTARSRSCRRDPESRRMLRPRFRNAAVG